MASVTERVEALVQREALCALVRELGHDVLAATSGGDALAQVEHEVSDVVLLGLLMPDLDGFEVTRPKGLRARVVHYKHALSNAILPLITLIALDLPSLFAGALFDENLLVTRHGTLFWDAAKGRDYPVLLSVVMITAVLIIVCNILADLAYGWLNPRVKYE